MKVILDGLNEGAYRIFVQTYDREGNKSLNEECNGYAYGENFILSATVKIVTKMDPQPDGMALTWSNSEDAILVEVQYEDNTGMKTLTLPGNVSEYKIADWKLGGNIRFRTAFIPEAGAIDTFYSEWINQSFPDFVEYTVVKSKIRYLIIRTTEVFGPPSTGTGAYVILREMTLYSDDITK